MRGSRRAEEPCGARNCVRALCLRRWDSEAHRVFGAVRGWPRRPARSLQLDARSGEEDAHGRRAPAASLSAFLAAAAALGVHGDSEARPGARRENEECRPSTLCPDPWRSQRARARRPGWARGSRPPPGAAERLGHRGPAERRSRRRRENLCRRPCPGAEPSAERSPRWPARACGRPGPRSPNAGSSLRAPDKMARPVRRALGAPRRSPCLLLHWLLLLLVLLRLEPASAAAGPRAPCAAACTCAGDSLDCGGRGLAALPGDLPVWTRSL